MKKLTTLTTLIALAAALSAPAWAATKSSPRLSASCHSRVAQPARLMRNSAIARCIAGSAATAALSAALPPCSSGHSA